MTRIGITGHQGIRGQTARLVTLAIGSELDRFEHIHGISSLADGADQIFAEAVLARGGRLTAVVPASRYEDSFESASARRAYRRLLGLAGESEALPFEEPSEEAYWAAGQRIVTLADVLFAVWDGEPAGGLGGTGDVVAFAREQGTPTTVIWPAGCHR